MAIRWRRRTSLDGTLRLWDVATRQELGIIDDAPPDLKLQFSPDGSILAGNGGGYLPEVLLWTAPRGEKPGHCGPTGRRHMPRCRPAQTSAGKVSKNPSRACISARGV